MIIKLLNNILDNVYPILLFFCMSVLWLKHFGLISVEPVYYVANFFAIPFLLILWKVDKIEKKLDK